MDRGMSSAVLYGVAFFQVLASSSPYASGGARRGRGGSALTAMAPLRTVRTMCPMNCHPTLCGMLVDLEDGRVVAVRGDPDNPDSRGFLCMRGHASREIIDNPHRVLHPLRRTPRSGAWQRTTWEDALRYDSRARQGRGSQRGGRVVGARLLRQQLRDPPLGGAASPFRESLRLPDVDADHDLLGARRLRPGPDRPVAREHQGGHGSEFRARRLMGRKPRQPAEHRTPSRAARRRERTSSPSTSGAPRPRRSPMKRS